jgi:two-component system OmpR family sensor kinase
LSLERSRSTEDQRTTIARIESEAARMARIVEGLLVLARADARSAPTNATHVDLGTVLDAAVRRATPRAAERGVRIDARIAPGIVVADRDGGLERVFDNLLDNALRYAPGGSAIEVEATARDGLARVTTVDHGPGIPPDERARVFERFHRSPGASGRGAGLGLAIADAIVTAARGRISVSETPGGGATFVVALPVARG